MLYVSDDNQGNVAISAFRTDGVTGAINAVTATDQLLDLSKALDLAPLEVREDLTALCALPLLQEGSGISAVFWSSRERLETPLCWPHAQGLLLELFRRELMSDSQWTIEGAAHYVLSQEVARTAVAAAGRAALEPPLLTLARSELRTLIPRNAPFETTAVELLFSDGVLTTRLD